MATKMVSKFKSSFASSSEDQELLLPSKNRHNVFLAALSALLYIVVLGMVSTYSAPASVDMKKVGSRFINITPEEITWIASLPALAGAVGNAMSGYVSHKLGRKTVLMYISGSYTISWLAIAYAPSLSFVYAGRLISGFCSGISSVAVPAYIVEISTVEIRGLLTSGYQVAFTLGVFLVIALGIVLRWSWLAISGAFAVVIGAYFMYFMPESPPWLIRASRTEEAVVGLNFLRGSHRNAANEMKELVEHIADEQKSGISLKEFRDPALYKPVLFAVALMFFQQFSGINPLMTYSVENFQNAKSSIDPSVSAAIVALVQVVATIVSSLLMDRAGRRILYITSGIFMTLSLLSLGIYSYYNQEYGAEFVSNFTWIPLVSFVFYITAFSLGFGPVPMVVVPEMIPIRSRSFLIAVANTSSSFFGFIVTKTFEDMRSALGMAGLYWLYAVFTVLGFMFYCILIPETKGRTIRDIHRSFSVPKSS